MGAAKRMAQLEQSKLPMRAPEELSGLDPTERVEDVQFPELLIILAKWKFFILKFVGAVVLLAIIFAITRKNVYTATTKLLPPQQNQSMSTTAMLSQLGPLGALAGQSLGLRNPSAIYVAMLHSRVVADNMIERFSLMKVYKEKLHIDTQHRLEGNTLISTGQDGTISISVSDLDQKRAADMANAYVEELEKLTKTLAVTEASKRRSFFERETNQAMDDLANAELALKKTQEKTGLILLDPQSRAMIEALSSLRAQIASKQVQLQAMQSFATAENPDLVRAQGELAALRDQLARLETGQGKQSFADLPIESVPTVGLEYVRKYREVKYREALFELLAKQYEAAKIDEARDSLIVQQLDKAYPPERKSGPYRALIVIAAFFLASLVAIGIAFFLERLKLAKEGPQFAARLQLFRYYLRGKEKSVD